MKTRNSVCFVAVALFTIALSTPARAQGTTDTRGSATLAGGATIGHELSGIIAGEAAVRVSDRIDVFVEADRAWNVAPADLVSAAQSIAAVVRATAATAVRVTGVDAGVRVRGPMAGRVEPYACAGAGVARVASETTFSVNGAIASPDTLGLQVGSDLSSAVMKPLLAVGAGVLVPLSRRALLDVGVRYQHIFARPSEIPADAGLDVVRLQIGVGVRF